MPAYRKNINDEPIVIAKNISNARGILFVISLNNIACDKNQIIGKTEKAIILTPKLNNLFESLLIDISIILPSNNLVKQSHSKRSGSVLIF
jgi:hypothetical protein